MSWLSRKSMFDQFSAVSFKKKERPGSTHQGLTGRVCLISDASTTVGSGICHELLRGGAIVVAPLRSQEAVDRLVAECSDDAATDNLHASVADLSTEEGCAALVGAVKDAHGRIDHAVSCFGQFWQGGPLTQQPLEEFHRLLRAVGAAHFLFAKHALPALKRSSASSFLFVSEGAGKRAIGGKDTSLYSVASSTVYGIIIAAQEEFGDSPIRVNEMRMYCMLKRAGDIGNSQYKDVSGLKAYSNRKVGRLAVDALLSSKKTERIVVTPALVEGASVTV